MKPENAGLLDTPPHPDGAVDVDPNPPHGRKGGFRKVTMTLPPWAYQLLIQESARRKIAGEPNHLLSALLREAMADYLEKLRVQSL